MLLIVFGERERARERETVSAVSLLSEIEINVKRRARTRVPEQIGRVPPNYLIIFQMGNPEGTRWLY